MPRVKRGMIVDALWCPRAESNHDLMITNQNFSYLLALIEVERGNRKTTITL